MDLKKKINNLIFIVKKNSYKIFPIVIIILVLLFYWLFLTKKMVIMIESDGHALPDSELIENLVNKKNDDIETINFNAYDNLLENHNKLYLSNNEEISGIYPLYLNDNLTIMNIQENNTLITTNYEELDSYKYFSITNGNLYNHADMDQADQEDYLFLKLINGCYVNCLNLVIKTNSMERIIPMNSIIYLDENVLRYYEPKGNKFIYKEVIDIDNTSLIEYGNSNLTFLKLLQKLKIVKEEQIAPTDDNKKPIPKPDEDIDIPIIKINNIVTKVYGIKAEITGSGDINLITKPITILLKKEGRVFLRKRFYELGEIRINGLKPDETYQLIATYSYRNADNVEENKVILNQKIKTLSTNTLKPINISFSNGKIYSDKIEIINLKISDDSDYEAVYGVAKAKVVIGSDEYNINNYLLKEFLNGKLIEYSTPTVIKTNQLIDYEIKLFDNYGNDLLMKNNKGKTRTAKAIPKVKIDVLKNEVNNLKLKIILDNPDSVNLDNYNYIIFNSQGKIFKQGMVPSNGVLTLTNLDSEDWYLLKVLGTYDLEDGNGIQKDKLLNEARLTAVPLTTLGFLRLDVVPVVNYNTAKLSLKIKDITDKRLLPFVTDLKIMLSSNNGEKIFKKLTLDELQKLLSFNEISINFKDLSSKTKYELDFITTLTNAGRDIEQEAICGISSIKTLKKDAQVYFKNRFTTNNFIDFDVMVDDLDESIQSNRVMLEVRNKNGKLILMQNIIPNSDFVRITLDKLKSLEEYSFTYIAESYNIGYDNSTYQEDYKLLNESLVADGGIFGSVKLDYLENKIKGKNLLNFNQSISVNNSQNYSYKKSDNKIKFTMLTSNYGIFNINSDIKVKPNTTYIFSYRLKSSHNNIGHYSPEILDSRRLKLTSFSNSVLPKTRLDVGDNEVYAYKFTTYDKRSSLTLKFYIGMITTNKNIVGSTFEYSDFMLSEGDKYISYIPYNNESDEMTANIITNVNDSRNEIKTNDYYLDFYEEGHLINTLHYDLDNTNRAINVETLFSVNKLKRYKIVLKFKIRERFYDLSFLSFDTSKELDSIYDVDDFFLMDSNGNYLVQDDLDFRKTTRKYWTFTGYINFQGHKVITSDLTESGNNKSPYIIGNLENGGTIENVQLELYLRRKTPTKNEGGLVYGLSHGGIIRNVQAVLKESLPIETEDFGIIANYNYGVIENFTIKLETPFYALRLIGGVVAENRNTVKNGYVYGERIDNSLWKIAGESGLRTDIGGIVGLNSGGAFIENVFVLSTIDTYLYADSREKADNTIGNIAGYNGGIIRNSFSVGDGINRDKTKDINGFLTNKILNNTYYVASNIYNKSKTSTKVSSLTLKSKDFYNQVINITNNFNVDDMLEMGYYPQVKMPDIMPRQEFVSLPDVLQSDIATIISSKVVESKYNEALIEIAVHNPNQEKITNINIQYLNTEIINQITDEQETKVTLRVTGPEHYFSSYDIREMFMENMFNISYKKTYEIGESKLMLTLYRTISNINDWQKINSFSNENFILLSDLDFKGFVGNNFRIVNTFKGELNGNGFTIRNIDINGDYFIRRLDGKLENLIVENINLVPNGTYASFIMDSYNYAIINEVTIKNMVIKTNRNDMNYIGILVGYAQNLIVTNSSILNSIISIDGGVRSASVGGMVGYLSSGSVSNSFVSNLKIDLKNSLADCHVGGIAGRLTYSSAKAVYSTGKIYVNAGDVGGIVGLLSGWSGKVEYSYSNINIIGSGNNVGGIVGKALDHYVINHNLSMGDISSTYSGAIIERICGNVKSSDSNYAWNKQRINGFVSSLTNGEKLKNIDALFSEKFYSWEIQYKEDYDLKELDKNILPKLLKNNKKPLTNQPNLTLIEPEIYASSVVIEKRINDATVLIEFKHNPGIKVKSFKFDYLKIVNIKKIVNENERTLIEVDVLPERSYDCYELIELVIDKNNQNIVCEQHIKVGMLFYKDINNIEDWQKIDSNSLENYRLNTDLDFLNIHNVNANLKLNRLESSGGEHIIKNISVQDVDSWSLIKVIKSSISNIIFANIDVGNTGSKSSVYKSFNLINTVNSSKITNLKFNNISINTNTNNVGIIGYLYSSNLNNIDLRDIDMKGYHYVGGLASRLNNTWSSNIKGKNINISGNNYVGGIFGYFPYEGPTKNKYIDLDNIVVKGNNYVGGFAGYASASNLKLANSDITGHSFVGGISYYPSEWVTSNITIINTHVKGSGDYIGGFYAQAYHIKNAVILDSIVEGVSTNSKYVGGIIGNNRVQVNNSSVVRTQIKSLGDKVGGISGMDDNNGYTADCSASNNFVLDSEIIGRSDVGGISGYVNEGLVNNSYVARSFIQATNSNAGGFYGLAKNDNVFENNNYVRIKNSMIQGSTIIGENNVGGILGTALIELNNNDFDGIFVDAILKTTNKYGKVSSSVGNHSEYSSNINNLKVYDGTKINGNEVKSDNMSGLISEQLVTSNDLRNIKIYSLNTYYWELNEVSKGYYPKLKNAGQSTLREHQENIDLPGKTMMRRAFMMRNFVPFNVFPTYKIYASSIDEINVEFSKTMPKLYFKLKTDNDLTEWIPIEKRVYTFSYDYRTDFNIILSDGKNNINNEIKAYDLKHPATLFMDYYYYIFNDSLYTNNKKIKLSNIIHVYNNKALSNNGKIYDLENCKFIRNVRKNFNRNNISKPIYSFTINGLIINTYANFSIIRNGNKEKIQSGQLVNINNHLVMLNENLNNHKNMNIVDAYNNKEFQVVLGNDGKIYNLKEKINVPNDFKNKNIRFMTDNVNCQNGFVIIQYKSGQLYGFNYRTGQKIFKTKLNFNTNILKYIENNLLLNNEIINKKYKEYKKSEKIKNKLYLNNHNDSQNLINSEYITSYNPVIEKYEVYDTTDILKVDKKDTISKTQEMYKNINLFNTYLKNDYGKQTNVTIKLKISILLFFTNLIVICILLGFRQFKKQNIINKG